jgi:alpha-L-rhamnosidase
MNLDGILISEFRTPSAEYRPWTRWWWPGGDVEIGELRREVKLLADTMFGGAEIQPFTAGISQKTLNDPASAVYDYDSTAYYEKLVAVIEEAGKHGIQIDLTMGSGWPAGGKFVPLEDNVDTLLYGEVTVTRAVNMPVPTPIMPFAYALFTPGSILPLLRGREWVQTLTYHPESARLVAVVAAKITENGRSPDPSVLTDTMGFDGSTALDITDCVSDGHLQWQPPSSGAWQVIAIYTMPSGSRQLITAQIGETYAVDPFDSDAITRYYENWIGKHPELLKFAATTLRALFSDSYEYFPQRHFADDLIETFRANRGYDVTPFLPAVFQPARDQHFFFFSGLRTAPDFSFGDVSKRIIHDYELTISDLFFKHWYATSRQWIEDKNLQFRQQGYNPPLDVIKAAGAASIPETEGGNEQWLKRVASGGHLYGRPLITAESFVFLPQGGFALTPQDYKQGIDLLMTAGVNQIIYHGTPYRWEAPDYGEIGWSPFISPHGADISANISEADVFWKYQAEINTYAARLQALLRQGKPDADLVVYLPLFDKPDDSKFAHALQTIDARGRTWEWVNDELLIGAEWTEAGLKVGEMLFQGIVLPNVQTMPLAVAESLAKLAEAGAPVAIFGQKPAQQPGYLNYQENDHLVGRLVEAIISQSSSVCAADVDSLAAFVQNLPPGKISYAPNPSLRCIRRRLDNGGHIAFLRNTTKDATNLKLTVDPALSVGYWFDAVSGNVYPAEVVNGQVTGSLPGFGSIALVCSSEGLFAASELTNGNPVAEPVVTEAIPLKDWSLEITGEDVPGGRVMIATGGLGDWRVRAGLIHVSSPGLYTTQFHLNSIEPDKRYILDLGEVFAAAEVTVNGQTAGHAIFSPYQVDVTEYVRAGDNVIEVVITPTLRNRLIGKALSGNPEYAQFGGGFMGPSKPVPSGLVGSVTLNIIPRYFRVVCPA